MVYPYNRVVFNHEKNGVLTLATTWMSLARTMLSEKSQSQKTTYYEIPFIMKTHKKGIYRNRKQISGFLRMGAGGDKAVIAKG